MKKLLWVLVATVLLAFPFIEANATSLSLSIQHRDYADGRVQNRFALIPSPAGDPLDLNTVTVSVNGTPTNLTVNNGPLTFNFSSFDTINGRYNPATNSWLYDASWGKLDYYSANVDSLLPGNYAVTVKNTSGQLLDGGWAVLGNKVNLPIVNVNSFSNSFDSSGNLYLSWAIPTGMPADAFFGVFLDGMLAGNFVSEIAISDPNYINSIVVPYSILEGLGKVDYLSATVLVRSGDGYNRSYSYNKNINLPDSVPEPTTVLLLGIGLVGLASFAKKKFKKS